MFSFPTLTTRPSRSGYTQKPIESTLVNPTDGGYEYSRPGSTLFSRFDWQIPYTLMPQNEKDILELFRKSVGGGGGNFLWQDPAEGVNYVARFPEPPEWTILGYENGHNLWGTTLKIRSIVRVGQNYSGNAPYTGAIDGSNTIFTLLTPVISPNFLVVFLNGVLQSAGSFAVSNAGATVTLVAPPQPGDTLTFFICSYLFVATPTQVAVTGTVDGINVTFNLAQSSVGRTTFVFQNGLFIPNSAWSVSGATLTMVTPPAIGDTLNALLF